MPPKKKGKSKKQAMLIDGVDTSQMTREQLEAFALRLKAEMEREREERNFFQIERDKIRTFWEISRQQLEEARTELRQKVHEVELTQEMADMESKQISQQMKHLQFENQIRIREARAEAMVQLKMAEEQHVLQQLELCADKGELRKVVREFAEVHEQQLQKLRVLHNDELLQNRIRFERDSKDIHSLYQYKMKQMKADLELNYRMQMFEVEERKNTQILRLIENHELQFNDMKNYYNDITLNNLGLISSLKEQMEVLRKQTERSERIAADTIVENRRLKEPLEIAQNELAKMKQKLEHFHRDRNQLARLKTRNAVVEKQLKSLNWETEALLLRNDTLVKEREDLKDRFHDVIIEIQQKTGYKTTLLERKIETLENTSEKRELLLKETIAACDATKAEEVREESLEQAIDEKNKLIADLRYEILRVSKAHDDLISTYEAKLKEFGIPLDELGFEPMRLSTTHKRKFLCGPAGLVAKNK